MPSMIKILSASRLNDFLGCRHRSALWFAGVAPPPEGNPSLELVREKGFEHEARVLTDLEAVHGPAVSIPADGPFAERLRLTAEAMAAGAPLIYQAAFANDRWVGYPDFLIRTGEDEAGRSVYEPEDAKLAHRAKAEHLIQLNVYARLIEEAGGGAPASGAIHVGGGAAPERFDLRQTHHISSRLMKGFESFAVQEAHETAPVRSRECGQCAFLPRCEAEWRAADSPLLVAGIRNDQVIKLERAGVGTLSALATADPATPPQGLARGSWERLVRQARLQKTGAERGEGIVELLPVEPGRGFNLMPLPTDGDLFFDMEGDPLYPEGLEYLFGLSGPLGPDGEDRFLPIWAHDHAGEKTTFETFMRLLVEHFGRYPQARVYHYAPYETVALKRLAMRYATMEAELDQMLRDHRFVDLYRVVRQGLQASTEGYSLKDLEKIYWGGRDGEVTNAGDSIVEYERWRETGEPAILDAICRYNEDDVRSTERMRDWLEGLRPAGTPCDAPAAEAMAPVNAERAAAREAFEQERRDLAERIRASGVADERVRDLLAELLWFHQRSQKPAWWAVFERQDWATDELVEDAESLGDLTLVRQAADKKSWVATYRFPPQDTRLKVGGTPKIAESLEAAGTIVELEPENGHLVLRRGMLKGDFPDQCSLTPGAPIDQGKLVSGVMGLVGRLCADPSSDQAMVDMLLRRTPRLAGRPDGAPVVQEGQDLVEATVAAVRDLEDSTLLIQGPPGTGKTYTSARAIVALLQDGRRVGVSSNSHKAIHNILAAVQAHADEIGFAFDGVKKGSRRDDETAFESRCISTVHNSDEVSAGYQLVGATAWHFATEDDRGFDVLFVDEAGQAALGNLAAMSGCARSLVLVGDQMQLPQPVQGVHPGESGLSCLDYALQDHATTPPARGILLDVSRRMHPGVCGFISSGIYEGRLTAHASTSLRRLEIAPDLHPAIRPAGVSVVEVDHQGCTQSSREEADVVARLVGELLGQQLVEGEDVRPMGIEDIVVVSPFNMQVATLKRALPPGARVGTVDKFQGQEAAVVIVSMATSCGADAPRGTEFLFNRNRLNVAISRAKCLAILVRGSRLLEVPGASKEDLPRLDLLARLDEAARH
jgi:predicted RecB family nuclease